MFDRQLIDDIAATCNMPTGDPVLDGLFDAYNEASPSHDVPVYYRFLYRLAKAYPGLRLVELGCKYGAASLHFLKGGGGPTVAVDCGVRFKGELFTGLPTTFKSCLSVSDEAIEAGPTGGRPDIVFIDTDHSYGTTEQEFRRWRPLLAPGGIILFDDIGPEAKFGCGKFWDQLAGDKLYLPHLHPGVWHFGIWFGEGK